MKKIIQVAVVLTLFVLAAARTQAQTNTNNLSGTNLIMNLTIQGTAYVQSSDNVVTKARITSKQFMQLIASDLGVTLNSKAKLQMVVPIIEGGPNVPVVDAGDVRLQNGSDLVNLQPNFNLFRESATQATNVKGTKTTDYGYWHVSFDTPNTA